jgi:rhamnogalacturonyl hydrolase YesR
MTVAVALGALSAFAGSIQATWIAGKSESAPTVVLVGGLRGRDDSSTAVDRAVRAFEKMPRAHRRFNLYGIPEANPNGERLSFPPSGVAYRENAQSHYLWRWLGLHAPDLVVIVGDDDSGLGKAVEQVAVAGVGKMAAVRTPAGDNLLLVAPKDLAVSEAHRERDRRLARTPRDLAAGLSRIYGHEFDPPVYIPAMALITRLRLGQQADVERLLAPYLDGEKESLAKATSSHLAGHLIFAEMATRTGDTRCVDRVRAAADLAFTESGEMRDAMPMHSEMSDAVFMGCPILASAGKLTGDAKYFDMTARHFQFMQKLCLRPDGLYRHSPLNDAAWGRGNAFPALGLAWALQEMPPNHAAFPGMLRHFQEHMAALARFQDDEGMWHEVIDDPSSYAEFSATAMIATAMLRGVSHGWLERSYADRARAAWRAILVRSGEDGVLMDVCESTGKQKSAGDYLNRAASLGKDPRGGGMAMLLATEMIAQDR